MQIDMEYMDSPAATYVMSLSDASISDIGSPAPNPWPALVIASPEPKIGTTPENEGVPLFEPGDGDLQISVNGARFETHKYLIKRFQGLKALVGKQSSEISIQRDDISAEDFCEMFKVLYSSIITGPFAFTSQTLISTLRVATIYEYHELQGYCVRNLESLKLDAVKRIEIAQEFHLSEWEQPAYHELGVRDEPITREEARIIGLDAFVIIAEMREKEQRRRGKEIDAVDGKPDAQFPALSPLAREGTHTIPVNTKSDQLYEENDRCEPLFTHLPPRNKPEVNAAVAIELDSGVGQTGPLLTRVELNDNYNRESEVSLGEKVSNSMVIPIHNVGPLSPTGGIQGCATAEIKSSQVPQPAHTNIVSPSPAVPRPKKKKLRAASKPVIICPPSTALDEQPPFERNVIISLEGTSVSKPSSPAREVCTPEILVDHYPWDG